MAVEAHATGLELQGKKISGTERNRCADENEVLATALQRLYRHLSGDECGQALRELESSESRWAQSGRFLFNPIRQGGLIEISGMPVVKCSIRGGAQTCRHKLHTEHRDNMGHAMKAHTSLSAS